MQVQDVQTQRSLAVIYTKQTNNWDLWEKFCKTHIFFKDHSSGTSFFLCLFVYVSIYWLHFFFGLNEYFVNLNIHLFHSFFTISLHMYMYVGKDFS